MVVDSYPQVIHNMDNWQTPKTKKHYNQQKNSPKRGKMGKNL